MPESDIIRAAILTPGIAGVWGLPLRLVGAPGTAKSAIIKEVCESAGFTVITVLASLRDPTDFLGLPIPRPDGTVVYAPPAWAVEAAKAQHAVVFFDEINTAPPSVTAALLRVSLDRVVGDFVLPPTVRIMAAMNAVEDAAGGYDLPAPLANRFGALADWQGPRTDEWCSWLLRHGQAEGKQKPNASSAEEEEKRVLAAWPEAFARAAGIVTGFIRRNPGILHAKPASGSPEASCAWPSRRTWEMATLAMAASEIHHLSEEDTDRYVGAFVGAPAMRQLRTWLVNLDLPDPAHLLDGKVSFAHDPERLDRTMVVCSSCAALVAPTNAEKRDDRAKTLWALIRKHMDFADVVYPAVETLSRREVRLVRGFEDATKVLAAYRGIFQAAGML